MSDSLPAPITRADYYLATLCGTYSGDLPAPITREDLFLLYLLVANDSIADGQIVRGRNYLPNTRTMNGWAKSSNVTLAEDGEGYTVATWAAVSTVGWNSIQSRDPIRFSLVRGQTVTLSFDIRSDDFDSSDTSNTNRAIAGFYLRAAGSTTAALYRTVTVTRTSISADWTRYKMSAALTDDYFTQGSGTIDDDTQFYIVIYDYSLCSMQVRKVKLEIGSTATDWTPAPEDDELPTPITRTDRYLAYLCGVYDGDLPSPITRKDYYLATLCGAYSGDLPTPLTRADKYLYQLATE